MVSNNSRRLVQILIRLAADWSTVWEHRLQQMDERQHQRPKTSAEWKQFQEDDEALSKENRATPFMWLVTEVCELTGLTSFDLREAARKRFSGERDLVLVLNELEVNGTAVSLIANLYDRWPDEATRLLGVRTETSSEAIDIEQSPDDGSSLTELATSSQIGKPGRQESKMEWLSKAMLTVNAHPDWSDAKVARSVHKHPCTLSRSPEYQAAAGMVRGSKSDRTAGHITVDRNSGLRDVEAVAPRSNWSDDKTDRGQPIDGSKYFREYCTECNEPMKVRADVVGTNPVCEGCKR